MLAILNDNRKIVIAASVLILAVVLYLIFHDPQSDPVLGGGVEMVCITTGKMYTVDRDEMSSIPAMNPSTGERTLFPYEERDGQIYLIRRYGRKVKVLQEKNHYVDPETLLVKRRD